MNSTIVTHGYYPPSIQLPHYVANESSVLSLISRFGVLWAVVIVGSFGFITRLRPALKTTDHIAFVWMCLSAFYPVSRLMPEVNMSVNRKQRDPSIFSSKPISLFTIQQLLAGKDCSTSYGKNTHSPTHGI